MRLSGWQLPVEVLSATALTKAIQCPEQYRQRYVQKVREKFGWEAHVGSVSHAVISSALDWKREFGKQPAPEVSEKVYQDQWDFYLEKEEPDWRSESADHWRLHGLTMTHTYLEQVVPRIVPER